jgi:hypothetical protein
MNTEQIMQVALDLVGFGQIPLDSQIYVPGRDIKKLLIGIDIGAGELSMARQLGYDLVIAHHPVSLAGKYRVYQNHFDHMVEAGVPEDAAREAVDVRYETLALMDQVANHDQVASAAELLGMPFMNIHQPCDEMGRAILQKTIDDHVAGNPDASLEEVCRAISALPEFETALTEVTLALGDPKAPAGRVKVSHGAYTNGGHAIATAYFEAGIDTVLYIHLQPPELEKLRQEAKGNLIISGHIVSDEIGIDPLIDALRAEGLQVECISGLRHRRQHCKPYRLNT